MAATTDRGGCSRRRRATAGCGSLDGPGRGIAAAINTGIRDARYPVICQIDQDVILDRGWLAVVLDALDDPGVVAAQGHYQTPRDGGFWARVMGRDLEQRYRRMPSRDVDHVCTGNTAYRATALHQVGLLDESLGYGSDNDLSYRLKAAGHRLVFCPDGDQRPPLAGRPVRVSPPAVWRRLRTSRAARPAPSPRGRRRRVGGADDGARSGHADGRAGGGCRRPGRGRWRHMGAACSGGGNAGRGVVPGAHVRGRARVAPFGRSRRIGIRRGSPAPRHGVGGGHRRSG